jgi:hypothetical protein
VIGLGVWGREILSTLARLIGGPRRGRLRQLRAIHKKALEIAPSAAALADARALIDRSDVEAVVVATPEPSPPDDRGRGPRRREARLSARRRWPRHSTTRAPIARPAKGSRYVFQGGCRAARTRSTGTSGSS